MEPRRIAIDEAEDNAQKPLTELSPEFVVEQSRLSKARGAKWAAEADTGEKAQR